MTKPEILFLSFSYNGGMEIEGNYSYSISNEDDEYKLYASLNSGNIEIEKEISKKDYETFIRLFDDVDLASWNDADDGDSKMVFLDAATFYYYASFSDGTKCNARTLRQAPYGFLEAYDVFTALFEKMMKSDIPKN